MMNMQYKNVLVTGAAGFIGCYLSKRLLEAGSNVIGVDNLNTYYDVNLKKSRRLPLYAATKKSNELMAHTYSHLYNLPCTGLRFFYSLRIMGTT